MSSYTHLEADHLVEHAMASLNKINGTHWVHNVYYFKKHCFPHSNNDQPFFSIVIPCCWEDEGVELALACMNLSIFGPLSRIYIFFFLHGSPHLVAILVYPQEL